MARKSFNTAVGQAIIDIVRKPLEIPKLFDIVSKRQLLFQIPTGMFDSWCFTLQQLRNPEDPIPPPSSCIEGSPSSFAEIDDPDLLRYCQERVDSWVDPNLTYARFLNPWQSPYPNDKPDPTEEDIQAMCAKLRKYLGISVDDNDAHLLLRVLARIIIDMQGTVPGEIEALIYNSQMMLKYKGSCIWEGNQYTIKVIDFYQEAYPPLNFPDKDMHVRDMNISLGFRYTVSDFIDPDNASVMLDDIDYLERWSTPYVVKGYVSSVADLSRIAPTVGDRYGVGTAHPYDIYEYGTSGSWSKIDTEVFRTMYWETIPVTAHNTWKNQDTMYFIDHRKIDSTGVCYEHHPSIITSGEYSCMHVPNICFNRDRTPLKYQVFFYDQIDGQPEQEPYIGVTGEMTYQFVWKESGVNVSGYVAQLANDLESDEELGVYVMLLNDGEESKSYWDITKQWNLQFYWRLNTYYELEAGNLIPTYWHFNSGGTKSLLNSTSTDYNWSIQRTWYKYASKGSRTPLVIPESDLPVNWHGKITEDPYYFPGFSINSDTCAVTAGTCAGMFPYYVQVQVDMNVTPEVIDPVTDESIYYTDRLGNPISITRKAFLWQSAQLTENLWQTYVSDSHNEYMSAWLFFSIIPSYQDMKDVFGYETQSPAYQIKVCEYQKNFDSYKIYDSCSEYTPPEPGEPHSNTPICFNNVLTIDPGCPVARRYFYTKYITNKLWSISQVPGDINCQPGYSFVMQTNVFFYGSLDDFHVLEVLRFTIHVPECPYLTQSIYTGYSGNPALYSGTDALMRTTCSGSDLLVIPAAYNTTTHDYSFYRLIIDPSYIGGASHDAYAFGATFNATSLGLDFHYCPIDNRDIFCNDTGLITIDYQKPSDVYRIDMDHTTQLYYTDFNSRSADLYKILIREAEPDHSMSIDIQSDWPKEELEDYMVDTHGQPMEGLTEIGTISNSTHAIAITGFITYEDALWGYHMILAEYFYGERALTRNITNATLYIDVQLLYKDPIWGTEDQIVHKMYTGTLYNSCSIDINFDPGFFLGYTSDGKPGNYINIQIRTDSPCTHFYNDPGTTPDENSVVFKKTTKMKEHGIFYNDDTICVRVGDELIQKRPDGIGYWVRAKFVDYYNFDVGVQLNWFNKSEPDKYAKELPYLQYDGSIADLSTTNEAFLIGELEDEPPFPKSPWGFVSTVHNYTLFTENEFDHRTFNYANKSSNWDDEQNYDNGCVNLIKSEDLTTESHHLYVNSFPAESKKGGSPVPPPPPPPPTSKVSINISSQSCTVTYTIDGVTTPYSGAFQVEKGKSVTVTATPKTGYIWKNWLVNGKGIANNPYTFTADSNMSISTITDIDDNFITLTMSGGHCTLYYTTGGTRHTYTSPVSLPKGTVLSFSCEPSSGYTWQHWVIDGVTDSSQTTSNYTANTNMRAEAFLEAPTDVYTLTMSGDHCTLYYTMDGVRTQYISPVEVGLGTNLVFECVPDTGYSFKKFTVDGADTSKNPTYTYTVMANMVVSATTEAQLTHVVMLNDPFHPASMYYSLNDGAWTPYTEAATGFDIEIGTTIKFKADSFESGRYFQKWQVNGVDDGVNPSNVYTADGSDITAYLWVSSEATTYHLKMVQPAYSTYGILAKYSLNGSDWQIYVDTSSGVSVRDGDYLQFWYDPGAEWSVDYMTVNGTNTPGNPSPQYEVHSDYNVTPHLVNKPLVSVSFTSTGAYKDDIHMFYSFDNVNWTMVDYTHNLEVLDKGTTMYYKAENLSPDKYELTGRWVTWFGDVFSTTLTGSKVINEDWTDLQVEYTALTRTLTMSGPANAELYYDLGATRSNKYYSPVEYLNGTYVAVDVTPIHGYKFLKWVINGTEYTDKKVIFSSATTDINATCYLEAPKHKLTMNLTTGAAGTLQYSVNGGAYVTYTGETDVYEGDKLRFKAIVDDYHPFEKWFVLLGGGHYYNSLSNPSDEYTVGSYDVDVDLHCGVPWYCTINMSGYGSGINKLYYQIEGQDAQEFTGEFSVLGGTRIRFSCTLLADWYLEDIEVFTYDGTHEYTSNPTPYITVTQDKDSYIEAFVYVNTDKYYCKINNLVPEAFESFQYRKLEESTWHNYTGQFTVYRNETYIFNAVMNPGFTFSKWSDGWTEYPYTPSGGYRIGGGNLEVIPYPTDVYLVKVNEVPGAYSYWSVDNVTWRTEQGFVSKNTTVYLRAVPNTDYKLKMWYANSDPLGSGTSTKVVTEDTAFHAEIVFDPDNTTVAMSSERYSDTLYYSINGGAWTLYSTVFTVPKGTQLRFKGEPDPSHGLVFYQWHITKNTPFTSHVFNPNNPSDTIVAEYTNPLEVLMQLRNKYHFQCNVNGSQRTDFTVSYSEDNGVTWTTVPTYSTATYVDVEEGNSLMVRCDGSSSTHHCSGWKVNNVKQTNESIFTFTPDASSGSPNFVLAPEFSTGALYNVSFGSIPEQCVAQYSTDSGSTWKMCTGSVPVTQGSSIKLKCTTVSATFLKWTSTQGDLSADAEFTLTPTQNLTNVRPVVSGGPTPGTKYTVSFGTIPTGCTAQYSLDNGTTWSNCSGSVQVDDGYSIQLKCTTQFGKVFKNWNSSLGSLGTSALLVYTPTSNVSNVAPVVESPTTTYQIRIGNPPGHGTAQYSLDGTTWITFNNQTITAAMVKFRYIREPDSPYILYNWQRSGVSLSSDDEFDFMPTENNLSPINPIISMSSIQASLMRPYNGVYSYKINEGSWISVTSTTSAGLKEGDVLYLRLDSTTSGHTFVYWNKNGTHYSTDTSTSIPITGSVTIECIIT